MTLASSKKIKYSTKNLTGNKHSAEKYSEQGDFSRVYLI